LAIKSALYDFTSARDFYREATTASGIGMDKDLLLKYIEYQALILTPIAPHWADYIYQEVLHTSGTIQNALWPKVPEPSASLTSAREYVRSTSSNITSAEAAQLKKKSKGKQVTFDPKLPKKLTIFAAASFPAWQDQYIELVRQEFEKTGLKDDKDLLERVKKMGDPKKAMPFVQSMKRSIMSGEEPRKVFDRSLPFDELKVLKEMVTGLKKTTGCKEVEIVLAKEGGKTGEVVVGDGEGSKREGLPQPAEAAVPGLPTFYFENVSA
jgi:leucyl-tRNA synthetase